jgi:hypothetical protein
MIEVENGDQHHKNMLYTAVKGRFRGEETEIGGYFFILFDNANKQMMRCSLVANRNFNKNFIQPEQVSWDDFEQKIIKMRWKGEQDPVLTNDLKGYLENRIAADIGSEFFDFIKNEKIQSLKEELIKVFYKPINDMRQSIDLSLEKISLIEMETYETKKSEKEKQEREERIDPLAELNIKLPPGSIRIDGNFVLSPTQGIPIHNLVVGQQALVRLNPRDSAAQAIHNRLIVKQAADSKENLKDQSGTIPFPVEIFQVLPLDEGEYYVIAHLKDNIYVEILEQERVNVRLYNPETDKIKVDIDGRSKYDPKIKARKKQSPQLTVALTIAGALATSVLIILILLSLKLI